MSNPGDWWISGDGTNGLMGSDDGSIINANDDDVILTYCFQKDAARLGFIYWATRIEPAAARARLERLWAGNPQINLPSVMSPEPSGDVLTNRSARAGIFVNNLPRTS